MIINIYRKIGNKIWINTYNYILYKIYNYIPKFILNKELINVVIYFDYFIYLLINNLKEVNDRSDKHVLSSLHS